VVNNTSYIIKSWSILAIWAVFFIYDMVYRHYHYDNNGNLISHVHLYDKSSGDHHHSDDDFHWLDHVSNYTTCTEEPNVWPEYTECEEKQFISVADYKSETYKGYNYIFYLRGPPSVV
jgi:hypothetical protein